MGWRERVRVFFLFTFALIAVELAHDVYRYYAYAGERAQLRVLNEMVDAAGLDVVRTQLRADSLRATIEAMDDTLEGSRDGFADYDRMAVGGALSPRAYQEYRSRIASYNDRVAVRNAWFARLQRAVGANRDAVKQYNRLSEEIRVTAERMGELHYNVPSPVEAAVRNGLRAD